MLTVTEEPALPDDAAALLPHAPFDRSAAWFRLVARTSLAPGGRAFFIVVREAGHPVALWPMMAAGGLVQSLTCPYTCHYAPAAGSPAAIRAAGQVLRRFGTVRLEALDGELADVRAGLRRAGVLVLPYAHFGNWHEAVADWPSYLAARPGALREVIRRRVRAVAEGRLVPEWTRTDAALDAYQQVYGLSWKEPEPFPDFAPAFLRAAAAAGVLRMAVLRHEGRPVAAQYWTVEQGVATVLKLAHDERLKALSPGTVLTALTIRRFVEEEGVREVDFGRGDDDYKRTWTSSRRQRGGWLLANPLHPGGALAAARHLAGVVKRRRYS